MDFTTPNIFKQNKRYSLAEKISERIVDFRIEEMDLNFSGFEGFDHKLEKVATVRKSYYVNDSKSTNINCTWFALESISSPIIWIVGGIDKGNDYEQLQQIVSTKVKAIICLGIDNTKIVTAFREIVPVIEETISMKDAVKQAYSISNAGDTILLSPACASFDLFEDYKDRGDQFKLYVREL